MQEDLRVLVKGWVYQRGRTLKWLANEVGIDPSSLTRALRGEFGVTKRLFLAISAALKLTEEEERKLLEVTGYGEPALNQVGHVEVSSVATSSRNALAGVRGAPRSTDEDLTREPLRSFSEQVAEIVASFVLPVEERHLAQQDIIEDVERICRVYRRALDEGKRK